VLVVQLPVGAGIEVGGAGLDEAGVEVGLLGTGVWVAGAEVEVAGARLEMLGAGVEVAGAGLWELDDAGGEDTGLSCGWHPATAPMAAVAMATERMIRGRYSIVMGGCLSMTLGAAPRTLTVR